MKKRRIRTVTLAEHYRYGLDVIRMVALNYDGYCTVSSLTELIDDLRKIATDTINLKPVWLDGNGKTTYRIQKKRRRYVHGAR